jgi:hypothetical protein
VTHNQKPEVRRRQKSTKKFGREDDVFLPALSDTYISLRTLLIVVFASFVA